MNRMYDNIDVSQKIDMAINNGIKKAKKSKRNKIIVAVASICICSITVFGIINPAIAQNIPVASNIFEYLNSKANSKTIYNKGSQYKYSEEINKSVKDNGIEITINEAYCDGISAYFSYTLVSHKKIDGKVTFFGAEASVEGVQPKEDEFLSFLQNGEGQICDDYTYVGSLILNLSDDTIKKINEDGFINTKLELSELFIGDDETKKSFFTTNYGNWYFDLKINKDTNNIKEIKPEITDNGFTLDRIIITPASTVIEFSSDAKEFPDGTLVEGIDNNHNHIEFLVGGCVDGDNKKRKWKLTNIDENAKTLKIGLFDKNKNEGEKIAEYVFDIK